MAASLAAPDPYGPNSGIRLPPWVCDGKAFFSLRLAVTRTPPGQFIAGGVSGKTRSGNAMPVTRRDREKALPDAWWRTRIWRTQGPRNGNYLRLPGGATPGRYDASIENPA